MPMKPVDFFTYEARAGLYKRLYRDILKSARVRYAEDRIVRGHLRIKTRYLIQRVQYEHKLSAIISNYKLVHGILDELNAS